MTKAITCPHLWILHAVLTTVSLHKVTIEFERAKKKMKQVTKNSFVFCGMNNPMHLYRPGNNLLEGARGQADHESVSPWGKDDHQHPGLSMRKRVTSTSGEVGDPFFLPRAAKTCLDCCAQCWCPSSWDTWIYWSKSSKGPQIWLRDCCS